MKKIRAVVFIIPAAALLASCMIAAPIPAGDTVVSIYGERCSSASSKIRIYFNPTSSTEQKAEQAARRVWSETMGDLGYDSMSRTFLGSGRYLFQFMYYRDGRSKQYNLTLDLRARTATYNTTR